MFDESTGDFIYLYSSIENFIHNISLKRSFRIDKNIHNHINCFYFIINF